MYVNCSFTTGDIQPRGSNSRLLSYFTAGAREPHCCVQGIFCSSKKRKKSVVISDAVFYRVHYPCQGDIKPCIQIYAYDIHKIVPITTFYSRNTTHIIIKLFHCKQLSLHLECFIEIASVPQLRRESAWKWCKDMIISSHLDDICYCFGLLGRSKFATEWCFPQSNDELQLQRGAGAAQTCNLVTETQLFDIGPHGQRQLEYCSGVV